MENKNTVDVDKDEFYQRFSELIRKQSINTLLFPRERYSRMVEKIKISKTNPKKTPADYRLCKKYDIVDTPDGERMLARPTPQDKGNRRLMLVPIEEMYDIIREYHLNLNHAGRGRMMVQIKRKYKNITAQVVLLYSSLCHTCKNRLVVRHRNSQPKQVSTDSFVNFEDDPLREPPVELDPKESTAVEEPRWKYPELYSRGQVDLLSVMNESGEEYKYLMVYRNFVTKFIHLKTMRQLCVDEAVDALLEIFLVFGAPNILQSKNGIVITKPICRRIFSLCPDIKIVASDNVYSNQDFKGKSNEDILKMLNNWLVKTQNVKWQEGVKFVQHTLNTTFHEILCRTPSEITFGINPRKGLTSVMSRDDYEDILTEQDLIVSLELNDVGENVPKQLKLEESLITPASFIKSEEDIIEDDVTEDDMDIKI